MKRVMMLVVVLSATALVAAATTPEGKTLDRSAQPVTIAADGQAKVAIIVSAQASEALRQTAGQLQAILARMTGATLEIQAAAAPAGITLGTLEQFPDPSLADGLAIRDGYDGMEAYAIRSDKGVIRLIGATDLGASHAAMRFLELLGYRHYFMGPVWEIVPQAKSLQFDLNEVDRPLVWSRSFGFTRLKTPADKGDPNRLELYHQWRRDNRIAESLDVTTRHTWHAIPTAYKMDGYPYKAEFDAHPEYFALVDGKRTPPQLCVTNPGLQKLVVAYAQHYFKVTPAAHMVSLDPADTSGWCTCENCAKLGHHSAQPFHLANLVARELQTSHPGKYVGLLAYSWHSDPPDFNLEPNVLVQLTAGMNASKFSFDELLEMWSRKCRRLGVYEYYSYWEMDKSMLPGKGPQNRFDELPARIQRLVNQGVIAFTAEATLSFGINGMGYYLASRLMWDPTANLETLQQDFCEKAFGPAAAVMRRYYGRFNLSRHPLMGMVMLRAAASDLDEATKLASSRPEVLARLDDLKANMVYSALGLEVELPAENMEQRKERALRWFQWAYQTRNNYMTDWLSFRAAVGNHEYKPTLAAQFNEPTWNYKVTGDNPWRVEEPLTSAVIEARFQEIRRQWGPGVQVPAREFSSRYVVVSTDATGKAERELGFMNRGTLLLASRSGEPLEFVLNSSGSRLERQDMDYELSTLDGKTLHRADLVEGDNPMKLTVPAAGVYRLTCKRGGRGWSIKLSEKLPAAVLMEQDMDNRPQNMTGYLYVPRGTQRIGAHAQWGLMTMRDPAGAVAFKHSMEGDLHAIEVKPDMAGRMWGFMGKVRNLWFVNLPTVLSINPAEAFVPEDLARADGLKVIVPAVE